MAIRVNNLIYFKEPESYPHATCSLLSCMLLLPSLWMKLSCKLWLNIHKFRQRLTKHKRLNEVKHLF